MRGTGAGPGYSMRPSRAAVKRRRQNVLVTLAGAALVTGVIGFGLGSAPFMALNLVVDALLAFYVYLLVQLRRAEEQRALRYTWSNAA